MPSTKSGFVVITIDVGLSLELLFGFCLIAAGAIMVIRSVKIPSLLKYKIKYNLIIQNTN